MNTHSGTHYSVGFAGCVENQSGQRFLDGSAPRLRRHAASCETAGRESYPLPAGKDQKPSRGFGGGAPIGREAPVPSSLDEVQTNCDKPKRLNRNCGRFTARGTSMTDTGKARYHRVGCKCWNCSRCGPRRASMYCIRVGQAAEKHRLTTLLTLTLDPAKLKGEDPTRFINRVFADFRVYLKRKLGHAPVYIRILEYQKNGNAHFHVLLNCYLPQHWVSEAWSALGGGRIVDIKRVDVHRVSRYLSKYLTKEMILYAPKGARRVTTSRHIRLLEKQPNNFQWQLMRIPIQIAFDALRNLVTRSQCDGDGCLAQFETSEIDCATPFGSPP